jgi:hypothetical protein
MAREENRGRKKREEKEAQRRGHCEPQIPEPLFSSTHPCQETGNREDAAAL